MKTKKSVKSRKYKKPMRKRWSLRKRGGKHPHFQAQDLFWLVPLFVCGFFLVTLFRAQTHKDPLLSFNTHTKEQATQVRLEDLFKKAERLGTEERINFWSKAFLKNPQLLAPLGAGPRINDTTPLYPAQFDCTTFVETVGALSRSRVIDELPQNLIAIRYYKGNVSYMNRNHFPEIDWIPNNESAGILEDITEKVAKKADIDVEYEKKTIRKAAWFKRQRVIASGTVKASVKDVPEAVSVKLPYIPLEKADEVVKHIPNGAIINIVHQNNETTPVLITHQGFFVWNHHKAVFRHKAQLRHATRTHQIREVPFVEYLKRLNASTPGWKIVGFNVNVFKG